jgi:hypothetical protein
MRAAAVILFLVAGAAWTKYGAAPLWLAGAVLCVLGLVLYVANVKLVKHFIVLRAPAAANDESWKTTAGMGVVPGWVSALGWLATPAFVAGALWFLVLWLVGGLGGSS